MVDDFTKVVVLGNFKKADMQYHNSGHINLQQIKST
jgi:hypothetical protein